MKTSLFLFSLLVTLTLFANEMEIESLKNRVFKTEALKIEKTLKEGSSYNRFIASYISEGLKIYGLLTVPKSEMPVNGYETILFIHGYIPPKQYSTTGSYPTYQDQLAKEDFITFKPDLRGHGNSQGKPVRAHFSEKYVVDTMYALSSLEQLDMVDKNNIFYWGHSNGGEIGLRVLVITNKIKKASLWAGVVGSYKDMLETYNSKIPFLQNPKTTLISNNGLPSENPDFWNKVDPFSFLNDIETPIILHHGTKDISVPIELSNSLYTEMKKLNKDITYYKYKGDNHNISNNYKIAFSRDIEWFRLISKF